MHESLGIRLHVDLNLDIRRRGRSDFSFVARAESEVAAPDAR
jgi:hypothetical protein